MKINYFKSIIPLSFLFVFLMCGLFEETSLKRKNCPTFYLGDEPRFYVKSKTSRSISLQWEHACHEETYSLRESAEWVYKVGRSQKKEGPFEYINNFGFDWFYDNGVSNILLEPSTTYFYKLELHHWENGFLMDVGGILSAKTDNEENTPVLSQNEMDNATELVVENDGIRCSKAITGEFTSENDTKIILGKTYKEEYYIMHSLLIYNEKDEKPYADFYVDIFETNGTFLGRVDNDTFESEDPLFIPYLKGYKYFKANNFNDFKGSREYQFGISQEIEPFF